MTSVSCVVASMSCVYCVCELWFGRQKAVFMASVSCFVASVSCVYGVCELCFGRL